MNDIKCAIIKDLLPLYIDGVVSDDTRELIEHHLKDCEVCQKELALMKQDVVLPIDHKGTFLKRMKKNLRYKKLLTITFTATLTALILFGAFSFVYHKESIIPYSEDLMAVDIKDDELKFYYNGVAYYGTAGANMRDIEIHGEKKFIVIFHMLQTIAESPTRNLVFEEGEKSNKEPEPVIQIGLEDRVDAVYYGDFEIFSNPEKTKAEFEKYVENAILLWER